MSGIFEVFWLQLNIGMLKNTNERTHHHLTINHTINVLVVMLLRLLDSTNKITSYATTSISDLINL